MVEETFEKKTVRQRLSDWWSENQYDVITTGCNIAVAVGMAAIGYSVGWMDGLGQGFWQGQKNAVSIVEAAKPNLISK